jgi:hypothetical protein
MSFNQNKSELSLIFDILKQQSSATSESWTDIVQQKFYTQYIHVIPSEFYAYLNALEEIDKSFEMGEENITALRDY